MPDSPSLSFTQGEPMPLSDPPAHRRGLPRPLSVALIAGAVAIPVMVVASLQPAAASPPARAGLQNGTVPISNNYVPVTGSIAAVNKAFGTTIKSYHRNNRQVIAPASALTIPAALAGRVSDVLGLDTSQVYRSGAKVVPNGASA